jgi:hypothetical protein
MFAWNLFFLETRCKEELVSQILSNSEVSIFSKEIPLNFDPREVPIRKVVPYFNYFPTIFYFKFFEFGKALFGPNEV